MKLFNTHFCLIIGLILMQIWWCPLSAQIDNQSKSEQIINEYEQFKNYRLTDVPKALEHANRAFELSLEISDSTYINRSARAIGWLLNSIGEYDTAFYYLKKSISISKAQNDLKQLKFVYNDAGLNRLNLSIYDEALDYFNESLKIRDQLKDYAGKGLAYNNIGLVYYNLENFHEAISFFKKGLEIAREFEDPSSESLNLANIGLSYHLLEDYQNAQIYFEQTIKKCEEGCPIEVEIQAIGGMGIIHFFLEQHDKAYAEIDRVINLSLENDVIRFLPSNYHYLASIEFNKQVYSKALNHLKISDEYAIKLQDLEWKKNNLELYAKIYDSLGNYEQAYKYHVKLLAARDSMLNADVVKRISDVHVNIQHDKDASIILGKDLEITERNQQLILFGVTIILSMILVFLLYRNNKFRRRINKKLDYKVKERTKTLYKTNEALIDSRTELDNFIYKISHDIHGPLATLRGICDVGLIDVQDKTGRDYLLKLSSTAEELNDIILRLQRVNQIISTTIDYQIADFVSLIDIGVAKARKESSASKTIATRVNIQEDLNFKTDIDLISIVVNNLISNAFQFYDNSKEESVVEITIRAEQQHLFIEISDNGIGIEVDDTNDLFRMFSRFSDRNRTGGIGLFLVKTAVDKLSGKISVRKDNPNEDTVFTVELPYEVLKESANANTIETPKLAPIDVV